MAATPHQQRGEWERGRGSLRADAGFTGSDGFAFQASNGSDTDSASVTIDVYNNAPQTSGMSVSVLHDQRLDSSVTASDPDFDMLTFSVVVAPANGSVDFSSYGMYSYMPTPNFAGTDSFEFSVSDGVASAQATVTIDVVNNAPTAYSTSETVLHDQTLYAFVSGIDPDSEERKRCQEWPRPNQSSGRLLKRHFGRSAESQRDGKLRSSKLATATSEG